LTDTYLHSETPLIESTSLSHHVSGRVWLKMESLQPSGSFKMRGVGHACNTYHQKGARKFISSSGGNAGIAVACCGKALKVPVTVVVPESTTQRAIEMIRQEDAHVIIHGRTWQEAHTYSLTLTDSDSAHIHPFDNPLLWTGHSTLIDDICKQGLSPDIVVLSVGGGGLLCGILEGLHHNGLSHIPVLAVETQGAESLALSIQEGHWAELDDIKSIATSLGAKKIARHAWEWCSKHTVISHVVTDRMALDACLSFATDHRLLVEPACGASLSVVYESIPVLHDKKNILVIVCGGAGVSLDQLRKWDKQINA